MFADLFILNDLEQGAVGRPKTKKRQKVCRGNDSQKRLIQIIPQNRKKARGNCNCGKLQLNSKAVSDVVLSVTAARFNAARAKPGDAATGASVNQNLGMEVVSAFRCMHW